MEPCKICATADVHLGMKFSSYPSAGPELAAGRFRALENIVHRGNSEGCDLLVVAGDLFNTAKVPAKSIERTAEILAQFGGNCILLLPGNHDYYAGDDSALWKNVQRAGLDRAVLLIEKKAYPLDHFDLPVTVYAAPCDSLRGSESAVEWIDSIDEEADRFSLGIAHGSIETISPDITKRYFPMKREELENKHLDLWIVGHTHVPYPEHEETRTNILIPGSPEPDGFDCRHEGYAWIIEIDESKQISARRFRTGIYRFVHASREIRSAAEVDGFTEELLNIPDPGHTLLKVNLTGSLPKSDFFLTRQAAERLAGTYMHLEMDDDGVTREITAEEIRNEFRDGSFPAILLSRLAQKEDTEALQTAYELLKESRK